MEKWAVWGGGAALLAVVASAWRYVMLAYNQLASRVIVTTRLRGWMTDGVLYYLNTYAKPSLFGTREFMGYMIFVRPRRKVEMVPLERLPGGTTLFWFGWKPMWVTTQGRVHANSQGGGDDNSVTLSFFRWMFDLDALLQGVADLFNGHERGALQTILDEDRFRVVYHTGTAGKKTVNIGTSVGSPGVPNSRGENEGVAESLFRFFRPLGFRHEELGPLRYATKDAIGQLSLTPEVEAAVGRIRRWRESRDWFHTHGIPWRLGVMFHGAPGTGKTATVRAVAQDLNMPIHVFDLQTFYNDELRSSWKQMLSDTPCIALIEDIDNVFDGRTATHDLSFDCLLNCIDGIERVDGMLLAITTNKIEKIDAALCTRDATRPGRIDISVEIPILTEDGRRKMASRILAAYPQEIEAVVRSGNGMTGAQFQDVCSNTALAFYYRDQEPAEDNDDGPEPTCDCQGIHDSRCSRHIGQPAGQCG